MGERDILAHGRTRRQFIGVREMLGFHNTGSADTSLSQGTSTLAKSVAVDTEIVTMEVAEADEIHHVFPIPWDLDRSKKVLGRVYFIHEANAADGSLVWKWGTKFFAKQAAMVEIQGNADVTTTFDGHTCSSTADTLEVTDWNDLSWDDYIDADNDLLVGMALEFDANGDAEDDECNLIGVEILYEPDAYYLDGVPDIDKDLQENPVY